jgi:hypothetical protein
VLPLKTPDGRWTDDENVLHSTEGYRHRSRLLVRLPTFLIIKLWHLPTFLLDNIQGVVILLLFPIPFRTSTRIGHQVKGPGGHELPAWMGCITLLNLLQNVHRPTPMTSERENLDHLTLSQYLFNLSR